MTVANRIPKPRDRAMGIMNRACLDVSNIIGASPPKVVIVVRKIGLKRRLAARLIACLCNHM